MSANLRLRNRMGDDTLEPVVQLCNRSGVVMEDASVIALSVAGPRDHATRERELKKLSLDAEIIRSCVDAASTLAKWQL